MCDLVKFILLAEWFFAFAGEIKKSFKGTTMYIQKESL